METTDDEPRRWWEHPVAVATILILGVASVAWSLYSAWPQEQPPVMNSQEANEYMESHHKKEREEWDKMWKKAGKQPPPFR